MEEALRIAAQLMALSARTAPKAAGQDFVAVRVIEGDDLRKLGEAMINYGDESGKKNFDRDGKNVMNSGALLLVGLNAPKTLGLNCGACGQPKCALLETREGPEFRGAFCAWRLVDLGIAIGSAVKTAGTLNVDNRIMYRAGVLARKLGMIEADVVVGVPLSATGKSPYFDR